MRSPLRDAFLAAGVAVLVTIPGLGNGTLWDNSETAYGEVAREILLTHNWIVMHLNGVPWFVQPPLYFWIGAICAQVFGVTSFALRLPGALATIALGGMIAYAASRQVGSRAGLYAGIILSTSLMQAVVGRLAIMDALLDLTVALSIFWWFRCLQTGRERYFLYGWIAAGFGFLAKGAVAPVIALLVVLPYAYWEWRATKIHLPSLGAWAAGLAGFAVIVVPWLAALLAATGSRSMTVMIGHYTIGRYTGTIENQKGPLWYYVPVIILGFFPWIAFVPSAIASGIARLRDAAGGETAVHGRQLVRLVACWIVMPLLFFSFANTKLPNYIALELPALALLVALYLDQAVERARNPSALVSTAGVPAFILLLGIAIVWFSRDNRLVGTLSDVAINLVYVAGAVFVGSIVAFCVLLAGKPSRAAAPYVLGVAMVVAVAFLSLLALPQTERFKPVPHLARIIDVHRRTSDAVAIINVAGGNALLFYTRPHIYVLRDHDDGRRVICTAPRTWLIGPRSGYVPAPGRSPKLIASWGKDDLYLYDPSLCEG